MTREADLRYHGAHLRRWRVYRGMSQAALAKRICTQATISNYETGKRDPPLTVAIALADRLRLPLQQMIEGVPPIDPRL